MIEEQLLDGKRTTTWRRCAVGDVFALAYADISTGHGAATAMSGRERHTTKCWPRLARVAPSEIVADVPAGVRAALAGALEASGARIAAPPLGLVDARERRSVDGFSLG